jgi:small multidrug resistance pump
MTTARQAVPRWHRVALLVSSLQCLIWGLFILAFPESSSLAYGLDKVPTELFLWQGTGLIILLFGVGYGIAATNPTQHWAVILIGLMAKILGPTGLVWSVLHGDVARKVLILVPINDVVWWLPFTFILVAAFRNRTEINSSVHGQVAREHP